MTSSYSYSHSSTDDEADDEEDVPIAVSTLPEYLRREVSFAAVDAQSEQEQQPQPEPLTIQPTKGGPNPKSEPRIQVLRLSQIIDLPSRQLQYIHLLLRRHYLTSCLASLRPRLPSISNSTSNSDPASASASASVSDAEPSSTLKYGLSPSLILARARVHEALGYPELAVADAHVAFGLCENVVEGEGGDLVALTRSGEVWEGWGESYDDGGQRIGDGVGRRRARELMYLCLLVLCRCAEELGCEVQGRIWREYLVRVLEVLVSYSLGKEDMKEKIQTDLAKGRWRFYDSHDKRESWDERVWQKKEQGGRMFGLSRREVYPWNDHEPDRLSGDELGEINARLKAVAPNLEVRKTMLPALRSEEEENLRYASGNIDTEKEEEEWTQLGLYATAELKPGSTILAERSVLTAIRPHGEALCDACAADMEQVPGSERLSCPGCELPFCSQECYTSATSKYHRPNEQSEETEEGYPPPETPFCAGLSGNNDIHTLGRAESSTTPEWDLYFLLVTRTLQMAESQDMHPLDLFETKYLWGDFRPAPSATNQSRHPPPRALPFSLRHHTELPLQWFEILMLSRPDCKPYSAKWLERYDWWVVQSLFAKFRGVADAKQSTWTGKPEIAAVHPLWCLANHSCDPNVTWKASGVRNLVVVEERDGAEWAGIRQGEEIWNHYTDVTETNYRVRRGRLAEVLGGECRCTRCVAEEKVAMRSGEG